MISGGATYCSGSNTTTNLTINTTGSGPINGTLSDGTSFRGIAPKITVPVTPTSTTSYTVTSLSDASCMARGSDLSGSATVTIKPMPTVAVISGSGQVLKGRTIQLSDATKGGVWSSSNTAVATVSSTGVVKGVSTGTVTIYYTVTSGGCSAAASKVITVCNPLTATVSITKILCYCGTATITITASGGSGGYLYSLNGSKFRSSNVFTVPAGIYVLVISDKMANQFTLGGIIIGQPASLGLKLVTQTNASSKTAPNGSLTVSGKGGTSPYQYSKNNGVSFQSSGTFSNLAAGTYKIAVKDVKGCVALNTLTVNVGYGRQYSSSAANKMLITEEDNAGEKITAAVYPNPTTTGFNLKLDLGKDQKAVIRVLDILGHQLFYTTGNAAGTYRFGENFPRGMYIVEVLYDNVVKTFKVVKQ